MTTEPEPEPLYARDGDVLHPSGHTRGPWDPGAQHGGAPAALLASRVQALAPDMQVARLTYEFLGPVPLAPCTLDAAIVKPGRRFQLAEATLSIDSHPPRDAVRVRAVLLRRGDVPDLPEPPPLDPLAPPWPSETADGAPWHEGLDESFGQTAMDISFAAGSWQDRGPAAAWFRLNRPVVAGEATPPVARAAAAADFGNGISRVTSFRTHLFVNTDLSLHLLRDPVGEWVCADARTHLDPRGLGLASSTLRDEQGLLGHAHQSLFVDLR